MTKIHLIPIRHLLRKKKKEKICALNNWYDVKREGSKLTGFVEQVKVVVDGHHS